MHRTDTGTDTDTLAWPFAALRTEMARCNTPPAVKQQLLAAFARKQAPRRWLQRLSGARWGVAGGATATLLLALTLGFTLLREAPRSHTGDAGARVAQRNAEAQPADGLTTDDAGDAFIALASFERIEQDPAPRLVEAIVPRTALAALGVPVSPENVDDLVLAEMLVGADGFPLALRLAL